MRPLRAPERPDVLDERRPVPERFRAWRRAATAPVSAIPPTAAAPATGPAVNAAADSSPTTVFPVVTAKGTAGSPPRVCRNPAA